MSNAEERAPWSKLNLTTQILEKKRAEHAVAINIAHQLIEDENSLALRNGVFIGAAIGVLTTLAVEVMLIYLRVTPFLIHYICSQ
jgi:hypothetical protein